MKSAHAAFYAPPLAEYQKVDHTRYNLELFRPCIPKTLHVFLCFLCVDTMHARCSLIGSNRPAHAASRRGSVSSVSSSRGRSAGLFVSAEELQQACHSTKRQAIPFTDSWPVKERLVKELDAYLYRRLPKLSLNFCSPISSSFLHLPPSCYLYSTLQRAHELIFLPS